MMKEMGINQLAYRLFALTGVTLAITLAASQNCHAHADTPSKGASSDTSQDTAELGNPAPTTGLGDSVSRPSHVATGLTDADSEMPPKPVDHPLHATASKDSDGRSPANSPDVLDPDTAQYLKDAGGRVERIFNQMGGSQPPSAPSSATRHPSSLTSPVITAPAPAVDESPAE